MTAVTESVPVISPQKEEQFHRKKSFSQKIISGMPDDGKVTFGHKFALAVGAGPITLPLVTTTVYIQMFLLDVARVLPMYATSIIVTARILDAVTDPTVGALVNKTQEKGGSLRKWMIFSLPVSILSFFFLWYVPAIEDDALLFVYYLLLYTVLQVAFTLYSIPFCSLVMYQSTDQSERDAATSFRLVGEAFFAIASLVIVRLAETLTESGSLENSQCDHNSTVTEETLSRYHQTFMIQGGVGSLVILGSGLYCFFASMENTDIHINAKIGMFQSFANAMTFKPYVLLALAYLAGYVAVNITQGCLLLYFKYVIDKESSFTMVMLALVVSGALSIPVWKVLIGKYGKRKVSFCSVAITVPAFSMLSVITKDVSSPWLIVFAIFTGPGCVCGFYIPWVLLPDVIDAYTVRYAQRNEGIFYGFFVFLSKLAAGCVTGGTMLTLKMLDYDATKCDQNESVDLALRVICAACPTFLLLLFGTIMYFFPLNEQKMEEHRQFLQETYFKHTINSGNGHESVIDASHTLTVVDGLAVTNSRHGRSMSEDSNVHNNNTLKQLVDSSDLLAFSKGVLDAHQRSLEECNQGKHAAVDVTLRGAEYRQTSSPKNKVMPDIVNDTTSATSKTKSSELNTKSPTASLYPPKSIARRKDYELLTVRHSLPTLTGVSNDSKSPGGMADLTQFNCSSPSTKTAKRLTHKRVVSENTSRS